MTKAWDDYKDAIIGEYKEHNKPLHEVQRIMEEKYRFKASTRAYRSRLDKWGVYKYSCRKRNGSSGANDDGSPDDDTPGLSPPRTPGQQHTSPLSDPECPGTPGPMSPMTPISRDQQLFGAPFSGTTSPSELGSPASANMKYEPQQSQYSPQHHYAVHPPRHSMSLPAPGYLTDPRFAFYDQPQHHQEQYTQHEYYRQQSQSNGYHPLQHPLQGQGPMNTPVSVSVPSSPNHSRYLQFNHGWMGPDQTRTPPE